MRVIGIIFALLFAQSALSYTIVEKSKNKKKLVIKVKDKDVSKGMEFVYESGDDSCTFKLKKLNKKRTLAIATTKKCSLYKKIKKGDKLEASFLNMDGEEEKAKSDENYPSKNESWYTYWGLGGSSISYEGSTQNSVDALKSNPAIDHLSIAMDLFGFYWPVFDEKQLLGFVINAASDTYEIEGTSESLSLSLFTYSLSYMKFFGPNVGSGLFLRGDAGIAKYHTELKTGGITATGDSDAGFGLLVGGGYAMPISEETRILFNLNFSLRSAESSETSTIGYTVGFLF